MKKRLTMLLKIGLALVVLGLVIYWVDVDQILASARSARPGWIVAAFLLLPLNLWLEGLLWHRLVQQVKPDVAFPRSLGALMSGYALGYVTPGHLGAYAGRAFYLDHPDRWMLVRCCSTSTSSITSSAPPSDSVRCSPSSTSSSPPGPGGS